MSYESDAEPIKLGYLCDFLLPEGYPEHRRLDLTRSFELVFERGREQGLIDRRVEIVWKEVQGLPKGSIKAVIDGFEELVDQGCLLVFGPAITDNAVPTRAAIEQRFHVPALSVAGSADWLGEWTFSLPMGSMSDEPVFWANLCASGGHLDVGVLVEQSLVGESYVRNFRRACQTVGVRIVAEERIPQTAQDVHASVRALRDAGAQAIVHCGFGFGIVHVNPALQDLAWDPPRFMGTAWQNAWMNPTMWEAIVGWVRLDQLDETNPVGERFLDDFEATYGRRPPTAGCAAAREPGPRHLDAPCVRRRASVDAGGSTGRARADHDGPRRVGITGYVSHVRELDAPGMGWHRLPRGPDAQCRRRQLHLGSTIRLRLNGGINEGELLTNRVGRVNLPAGPMQSFGWHVMSIALPTTVGR